MPGHDDDQPLSPEDQAALAEYERSGQDGEKPENRAAELTKLFNQTPQMREYRETADAINNKLDTEDLVSVQIGVPRAFLRLVEFLEQKRAQAAGASPAPAEKVLAETLINELHDQLHWLTVEPARFPYYRDLWNRFCDEQGAPAEKLKE